MSKDRARRFLREEGRRLGERVALGTTKVFFSCTLFGALVTMACSEAPAEAAEEEQPLEEHCRQFDDDSEGCSGEAWCGAVNVGRYEIAADGNSCTETWRGTLCLRLAEPKRAGQIAFLEVQWHEDSDGNIVTTGTGDHTVYEDLERCSKCEPCVTLPEQ